MTGVRHKGLCSFGRVVRHALRMSLIVAGTASGLVGASSAQLTPGPSAVSARAGAPVDLTGYWVSVVTEDWAWRMRTPPPGDYASVPLNAEGRRIADSWTVEQDGSCLAHGAAAALRMPTRAHITWDDDNTLRIDIDNGMQTRLLHFRAEDALNQPPSLQGNSIARWLTTVSVTGSGATGGILTSELAVAPWASLEARTVDMQAAWLRPNGVPYSSDAVLIEYFDRFADGDDEWFTVTTIVEDPAYLAEPFVVSSNFKREADGSRWNPAPCDN